MLSSQRRVLNTLPSSISSSRRITLSRVVVLPEKSMRRTKKRLPSSTLNVRSILSVPGSDKIDLTFNVDEGKRFFVRRIDFSGNTTTRDKVIRRELLIDEGNVFN